MGVASEVEARAFRERAVSTAHFDWSRAKRVRSPKLQPSETAIWLRLPVSRREQFRIAANKRDAPYRSPIKMWLGEKVG